MNQPEPAIAQSRQELEFTRVTTRGWNFGLEARPTGAGWWRLRYWIASKEGMLSLGAYPETGLRDARIRRDEARRLIAAGTDPNDARKAGKVAAMAKADAAKLAAAGLPGEGTFENVAREWLATVHEVKVTAGHAERTRIRFERDVFPWLGMQPLCAIEAPALLQCLRSVESRGAIETAHRIKDAPD